MVLSDHEIWMEIRSGRLSFTPEIDGEQVTPSSVDLRLSNKFTTFNTLDIPGVSTTIDLAKVGDVEEIANAFGIETTLEEGDNFDLAPRQFVLAYTREYIKLPNYLSGRVEGRSSFARLGISIHQTAPTVHATFEGQLRLEILNNGPYECKLSPGLRICQLVLERLGSPAVSRVHGLFQRQRQSG